MNLTELSEGSLSELVSCFSVYSDEIEALASSFTSTNKTGASKNKILDILNGKATLALQRLVPENVRKKAGIFFTSTHLADKVAIRLAPMLRDGMKLIDPACGAGNLLIACAQYLPTGKNLMETLDIWSERIFGCDLHLQFVRAAQLRLMLLAASLHMEESKAITLPQPAAIFKGLQVGSIFSFAPLIEKADCVIVNPSFGYTSAPDGCQWAAGKIKMAGLFFVILLRSVIKG